MQVVHTFCLSIIMEKWRIVLWSDVLARTESVRGAEDRDRSMSGDYCFFIGFLCNCHRTQTEVTMYSSRGP